MKGTPHSSSALNDFNVLSIPTARCIFMVNLSGASYGAVATDIKDIV